MSYILEALKRAEAERERERAPVPGLHAQPVLAPLDAPSSAPWLRPALWVGGGVVLALLAVAGWRWTHPTVPQPMGEHAPGLASAGGATPPAGMVAGPAATRAATPARGDDSGTMVAAAAPTLVAPQRLPSQASPGTPAPQTASTVATAPAAPAFVSPLAVGGTLHIDSSRAAAPAGAAAPPAPLQTPQPAAARIAPRPAAPAMPAPTAAPIAALRPPAPAPVATAPAPARVPVAAAPAPAGAGEHVYANANELPADARGGVPPLAIGGSIYSPDPAARFLIINGQVFHEGDEVANGLTLRRIELKAAVLDYKGYRFRVAY